MELKIGRYIFNDISNKDWILDNGDCYQVMTRRPQDRNRYISVGIPVVISRKLFNQLIKTGKIIRYFEYENSEIFKKRYTTQCKAWRFNVDKEV